MQDTTFSGDDWALEEVVRVRLADCKLTGTQFLDCGLRPLTVRGGDWAYVSLRGQNLTGARLGGLRLREADLTGADLTRADLRNADLRGRPRGDSVALTTPGRPAGNPGFTA